MTDTLTRRGYLTAALQYAPGPVTTQGAERLLAASPFSCHRNTARKDLRALVARGVLVAEDINGRRVYVLSTIGDAR